MSKYTILDNRDIDLIYNPESENAQSGIAVAEAVEPKEDKSNLIDDLKVPQSDLVGKYPSALAVDDLCRVYAEGLLHDIDEKVNKEDYNTTLANKQDTLVNGINIKTVNGQDLLGSGDIVISSDGVISIDQIFDANSNNAQSGKAVNEAIHKNNGMDLIGEYVFTGEETSTKVTFSTDANGNSFNLDEVFIEIVLGASTSMAADEYYSCYTNGMSTSEVLFYRGSKNSTAKIYQAYGRRLANTDWMTMCYPSYVASSYNAQWYSSYTMNGVDYIYKLRIDAGIVVAGTKIKVYGRRA